MDIKINVKQLINETEIQATDAVNTRSAAVEHVMAAKGLGALDIWQRRQDFIKAGIGREGVLAIECVCMVTPDCRVDPEAFGTFTREFMRQQVGADNVLSCATWADKNGTFSHCLLYPLNLRQLNPSKWIDQRTGQFKDAIKDSFMHKCADKFGLNFKRKGMAIAGHTQYLDEMPIVRILRDESEEMYYDNSMPDEHMQTDMPRDQMEDIANELIRAFTTGIERANYIKYSSGDLTAEQYMENAAEWVDRNYSDISKRDKEIIVNRLKNAALGFYVLEPLIDDENISDIKVCSPWRIRVKVNGKRRTSNLKFIDEADYFRFLHGIAMRYGLDLDMQAMHVFTDKYTNRNAILRNNITTGAINSGYPVYHIRKIPKQKRDVAWLIDHEVMDETVANYMIWAARSAKGIVFTGKGSSGKTTMMNALLEYIPANNSALVIQESEELFSDKPEITFQHITPRYDLKELARNGLLTDIDYFIIGEVKGAEAMYFINACDTGNKGWCSVHSPSSTEAIDKLADYVMYESKYDKEQALYMLKELQVVVFMKNFKVAEISEITGWDMVEKHLTYKTVYRNEAYL